MGAWNTHTHTVDVIIVCRFCVPYTYVASTLQFSRQTQRSRKVQVILCERMLDNDHSYNQPLIHKRLTCPEGQSAWAARIRQTLKGRVSRWCSQCRLVPLRMNCARHLPMVFQRHFRTLFLERTGHREKKAEKGHTILKRNPLQSNQGIQIVSELCHDQACTFERSKSRCRAVVLAAQLNRN